MKSSKHLIICVLLSANHGLSVTLGTLLRPPFGDPTGSSSSPLERFWNLAYAKANFLRMSHLLRMPNQDSDRWQALQNRPNFVLKSGHKIMLQNRYLYHPVGGTAFAASQAGKRQLSLAGTVSVIKATNTTKLPSSPKPPCPFKLPGRLRPCGPLKLKSTKA